MKKTVLSVVFAFLAGTLVSSLALAEDAAPPAKGGDATSRPHRNPGEMLKGMLDRVGATDEQKAKAEAIMKAAHEKAQAAQSPEEKMKIIREAMENVRNNVLTEEQRAKMPKPGEGRGEMLERLGLTAEQKAKVEAIMKEAREKAEKAESREDKMKIMQEARENVAKNVLTEEQRAKLPKPGEGRGGHGGMLDRLNLTADQKTKVEAIMKDAREKAEKAESREDKMKIMREAMENVRNNVLTEEQRAKMPKPGEGRGGHGGPGGPGGGPRPLGGGSGGGAGGGPAK